jgi:hypothetical protein
MPLNQAALDCAIGAAVWGLSQCLAGQDGSADGQGRIDMMALKKPKSADGPDAENPPQTDMGEGPPKYAPIAPDTAPIAPPRQTALCL